MDMLIKPSFGDEPVFLSVPVCQPDFLLDSVGLCSRRCQPRERNCGGQIAVWVNAGLADVSLATNMGPPVANN